MKAKKREDIIEYLDSIINNDMYVTEAQETIKEHYNVDSKYDKSHSKIYIYSSNVNEALSLVQAKLYLEEIFSPEMLTVEYGDKKG